MTGIRMVQRRGLRIIAAIGGAAALLAVATSLAAQGETTSLSLDELGDPFDSSTFDVSFSRSGRYVSLSTTASGLDPADTNGPSDVFVLDRKQNDLELVSRRSASQGGAVGNNASSKASISASGRYVAFQSASSNLSNADQTLGGEQIDVYVYDRKLDKVTLAARRGKSGPGADGESKDPSISANGRYVAFESEAENLASADDDPDPDIYVRDLKKGKTVLASRKRRKGPDADDDAVEAALSADGSAVAFETTATNLGGPTLDDQNAYVRDLEARRTELVSRASGKHGDGANNTSNQPALSGNGRYVVFWTLATNLSDADANGGGADVYVYDRAKRKVELASRKSASNGGEGADGTSFAVDISDSGRYVAFRSTATNLSSVDLDAVDDIFVRDRGQRETSLVSRVSGGGAGADDDCFVPVISPTGRYVGFLSVANNLSTDDDNAQQNAFSHDYLGP